MRILRHHSKGGTDTACRAKTPSRRVFKQRPFNETQGNTMSKIDIRRKHSKSHKAAKVAVDKTAAAIGKKFGIHSEWDGDTLNFHRPGGSGKIHVTKTEVRVTAELGFLMSALKPMIESEIERQLDENFG
jgi:putative polyhydroxyalkanoate system protein